jgi:hypothetical protein
LRGFSAISLREWLACCLHWTIRYTTMWPIPNTRPTRPDGSWPQARWKAVQLQLQPLSIIPTTELYEVEVVRNRMDIFLFNRRVHRSKSFKPIYYKLCLLVSPKSSKLGHCTAASRASVAALVISRLGTVQDVRPVRGIHHRYRHTRGHVPSVGSPRLASCQTPSPQQSIRRPGRLICTYNDCNLNSSLT